MQAATNKTGSMKKYILLAAILSLKIGGELRANNPYDTAIAVLQASVMPTKVGCGSIQGNYYIQNCNGGVSDSVVFPASQNYRFDFTGKGTQVSEVWPTMDIMIDGVTAASIVVNNAQPSIWTALINVTSGKHKVTMQFTNDNGLSTFKIFMALLYIFPNTKSISNVPVSYSLITKQALPSYGSGVLNSNHFMSGHLRGWNSGSIIRKNQTISPKDFADFKNYGANLLRAFVTLQSNGSTYSFTSHAIDSLDVFIQRARAHKIYLDVVITDSNTTEQFWGSTSLKNSYIDRCREVAARYKDSIEIACYSLGNEPTSTGNLGEYAMFAQTITAAIRSIDATRTIVFPFMTGVSTDVFNLTEPLAFDNVVYELHFYLPFHITHQGINPGDSVRTEYPNSPSSPYYNPSYLGSYDSTNMKKEPLILNLKSFSDKYNVPVLVSEFDCIDWSPNWSANRWLSDAINIFEKYGWSWCNHAYRQYEGWNNEIPQDKWYGFTFTNAKPNVSNIRQLDQYETDTTLQVILLKKYFALNVDSSSTSLHTFYHDNDGDGYGNNVDSIHTETPPQGYVLNNTDCDDTDANVHPGATEICDGKDNDCNGQIDEGVTNTFYADADGDSYGNAAISVQACTPPAGYVADNTDCDDTDANVHPGATEVCDGKDNNCDGQIDEGVTNTFYADADEDGYGNAAISVQACTPPAGYVADNTDCDDTNSNIHPGAPEICDGKDNNCNGQTDEAVTSTFYADADGDGYGDAAISVQACTAPPGYVADKTDCDDTNSNIHPDAAEICDGKDNNCNGQIDEGVTSTFYADADGDGYGNAAINVQACSAPAGYVASNIDCDDTNSNIHPGAAEICDGKDNNCNGQTDEGVTSTFYADAEGDGYGNAAISVQACSAPAGYVASNTDCNDTDANIHPGAAEICDGKDNNCNGQTDEGITSTFYADADKDGYGNPAISVQACLAPAGYVSNNKDCNDNDPAINPAAVEVCSNKIDDNCNGRIDEQPCYVCQNATGFSTTNITCNSAKLNWVSVPNPVQWKVQYKINAKGTSWIDFPSLLPGNIRSVTINSLLSNQEYLWRIRAKCGKTWTTYSNSILFKTSASCSGSVIASAISNNEVGNLILKLYPNPTKGQFVFEMHLEEKLNTKAKIQLIDMTGKTIQSENAEVNKGSLQKIISLSPAVTKGIYLVRIIVNDKIYKTEVIYSK